LAGLEGLTEKDLRRLSRKDLLVLMLDQAGQLEALEKALREADERRLRELEEQRCACGRVLAAQSERAAEQIRLLRLRLEYEKKKKAAPGPAAQTLARAGALWAALGARRRAQQAARGEAKEPDGNGTNG